MPESASCAIADLRTKMVMAARSKAEIVSALKAAFENKRLPSLESGAMAYMNVEIGLSDRRRGPQRTTSDVLYRAQGR